MLPFRTAFARFAVRNLYGRNIPYEKTEDACSCAVRGCSACLLYTSIHTTAQLQVVLVKPDRFDNLSEIAEHLRDKRAVVLNLESTNKDVARRLVDFLSGCAYALDGKIKKVAISTYIITPYNVDIMGDLIDELENNGLYF